MSQDFPALQALEAQLAQLDGQALLRRRRIQDLPCGPAARTDGRATLSFASNDYLGLAADAGLVATAAEATLQWGVGSGASHLVSGHSAAHEALEQRLAAFTGFDAALSFATGYLANIAVMPALLSRSDAIFADRLVHASLIDGALLSRAKLHRYPHLDLRALEGQLAASSARNRLIVTDSVFSMDGDVAPLPDLLELASAYEAWLLVDDAHGFGVLGPSGRGALAEAGLNAPNLILMGTLGKAAGVAGAFVAGHATLIRWLQQTARPYIFTTAAPPALAVTLLHALDLIEQGDARRKHLAILISRLREGLAATGWQLTESRTPIQPLIVGDNARALELALALDARGLYVPAIRPPTVPQGSARLRISLSAAHGLADVDRLIAALGEIRAQAGVQT